MKSLPRNLPLLAALVLTAIVGCSRPPDLVGVDNPEIPARAVAEVTKHRIFITTTRQASEVQTAFFSGQRAPELGLASVDVTVPPNHVVGSLERPTRLPPDPRVEFSVIDPVIYRDDASFIAEINRELAARPPGERNLLVFVHGFNNTTSDAILRLAQFVHDSGYSGVPVLFTWASGASATRYVYDLNSALVARVQLKSMADVLSRTQARDVDIFAHSMGTLLTMEGLVDAQLSGRLGTRGNINQIMLASPDIDIDLFRTQLSLLPPELLAKMFILVSDNDRALMVSRRLAGGVPRVGAANTAELEDLGVTVIDLSEIDDSSSGSHSKFAGSPEVVRLIGKGLNTTGGLDSKSTPGLDDLLLGVPIRIFGN
jgi:esterase/lipase superfamily enzyme